MISRSIMPSAGASLDACTGRRVVAHPDDGDDVERTVRGTVAAAIELLTPPRCGHRWRAVARHATELGEARPLISHGRPHRSALRRRRLSVPIICGQVDRLDVRGAEAVQHHLVPLPDPHPISTARALGPGGRAAAAGGALGPALQGPRL